MTFERDLRWALRSLRQAPSFTATAVLILGLSIGMSTAMFTVFRSVVLQDLPVSDQDGIVTLAPLRDATVKMPLSATHVDDLRRESRTLTDVAGIQHFGINLVPATDGERRLPLAAAIVTANFFQLLGVRPEVGRLLRPEDRDETLRVSVLSYRAWHRQFGGDPEVLGRTLTMMPTQQSYTIVGVAPPGLDYPTGVDYWVAAGSGSLPGLGFEVIGRLASDATLATAHSEFVSIVQRLDRQTAMVPVAPTGAVARSLRDAMLGDTQLALVVITAAVGLLLLIGCVNVGNLMLLRVSSRTRAIAIRRALGASPGRIAQLLVAESMLLGLAGGVLGLVLAGGLVALLLELVPDGLPRADMIELSNAPLGIAMGVTGFAVLLVGVLPALATARGDLIRVLRSDGRSGLESNPRRRFRQALVASQVALAVVMLAGAGLLLRSVQRLEQIDLGFDADDLSIVQLSIPFVNYETQPQINAMFTEVYGRLRSLPGVLSLTPVVIPPFLGANVWQAGLVLEGRPQVESEANPAVPVEAGGTDYFRTFGIPILRGRGFLESDREDAQSVVVVSQALATRLWSDEDPLGKRIRIAGGDSTAWRTVVGVAGDIRFRRLREPTAMLFLPWRQLSNQGYFAVRTSGDLAPVLQVMRRTVNDYDPDLGVWDGETMAGYLAGPLAQPRLSALLLSTFGLVALLMAMTGLYGVMASSVRERTRDLGVRMALGATGARLRRDVLSGALVVTVIGVLVGLIGALIGSRLLDALLFDVSPTDPATLIGVCLLLVVVALVAAYVPARRATRVDPMRALRTD